MNVFVTSTDPFAAAMALDDKRVVKMILESAQLLCTELSRQGIDTPYRPTHRGHPCAQWLIDHDAAQRWLLAHAYGLCGVYTAAYGKVHATVDVLDWVAERIGPLKRTPRRWANCARRSDLDISFVHLDDITEAYRLYLKARWAADRRPPTWTNRPQPEWLS